MASCPKCGRTKIKKNRKTGLRQCRRCGSLPGPEQKNRCGVPAAVFRCEPTQEERGC